MSTIIDRLSFAQKIWAGIFLLILSLTQCRSNYPETGARVGTVIKFTKMGLLRQTWEGQIVRTGMMGSIDTARVAPFNFTVTDDATAEKVRQYMNDQTEVVVGFDSEFIYSPWNSDSSAGDGKFLVSIEPTKK
jgi:hypothetical protein